MNELLAKLLTALGQTIAADASQAQFEAAVSSVISKVGTTYAERSKAANEVAEMKKARSQRSQAQIEAINAEVKALMEKTGLTYDLAYQRVRETKPDLFQGSEQGEQETILATTIPLREDPRFATAKVLEGGQGSSATESSKGQTLIKQINEAVRKKIVQTGLNYNDAFDAVKRENPAWFSK